MRHDLIEVITRVFKDSEGVVHKPASTLLGASGLADQKLSIEVEIEAVVSLV